MFSLVKPFKHQYQRIVYVFVWFTVSHEEEFEEVLACLYYKIDNEMVYTE